MLFELRSKYVNEVRTLIEAGIVPVMDLVCNSPPDPNAVTKADVVSHVTPVHLHQPSAPPNVGAVYSLGHQGSVAVFNAFKLLAMAHSAAP